jgi:modulator of FtsH protease HflC
MQKQILSLIAILLVSMGLYSSTFTVQQAQQAIVVRLGKTVLNEEGTPRVYGPGLHLKMPFIDEIKPFAMWLRTLDIQSSRIVTVEQKDVLVDAFVKWRISHIEQYFRSTNGQDFRAEALLTQKMNDTMRAEFGKRTIEELVSGSRTDVMTILQHNANEVASSLGVEIVDVRIKAIDLPQEVTDSVYARMRSDRNKEASLIRAEGQGMGEKVRAEADSKSIVIMASAKSQFEQIRSEGQFQAAEIYAQAYNKNPEFFRFLRSMQAYHAVFVGQRDTLILQPNGRFFEFFGKKGK